MMFLLSFSLISVPARAQAGQWAVNISMQGTVDAGVGTVTISGSGSSQLSVDSQGKISGTGTFQGTITLSAQSGCTGGGTWHYTESDVYTGQVNSWATGNATLTVTATGSTAPTAFTITCPNSNPPPATITVSIPIPANMATSEGTYSALLVSGYAETVQFPAPLSGSYTISVTGGTAVTTTTTATTQGASLSLTAPYGQVQVCDSSGNHCSPATAGEILQPGECIVTSSQSGIVARSANMEIAVGENSRFCLPSTREGISSLCIQAQLYATIQGQLHVGTWGMSAGQNVYIRTLQAGVCDSGTEFTVDSSDAGTEVAVLDYGVTVADLTSNNAIILIAGQRMTVHSSSSGMSPTELQQAVSAFDPATVDKWWLPASTTSATTTASTNPLPYGTEDQAFMAAALVLILIVAGMLVVRSASKKKALTPASRAV